MLDSFKFQLSVQKNLSLRDVGANVSSPSEGLSYEVDPDQYLFGDAGSVQDIHGRIYLLRTRQWFFENGNFPELVDVYKRWVSQDLYLHLALFEGEEKVKEVAVLCSKRGNPVYHHRLHCRLDPLFRNLGQAPNLLNRSHNLTRLLFVTLTYDTKLKSPSLARELISDEFNRWITNVRNKFGNVSYLKATEFTDRGYPHIHLVLFFKDREFPFFQLRDKWRIPRPLRDSLKKGWHSFVDIEAVITPRQALAYTLKYILKLHGKPVEGKTAWEITREGVDKTLALLWVYRLRGWTMSGDFEDVMNDLIPELCTTQTFQVTLDGENLTRWVLLGVRTAGELGIEDDPPPWVVQLWPE